MKRQGVRAYLSLVFFQIHAEAESCLFALAREFKTFSADAARGERIAQALGLWPEDGDFQRPSEAEGLIKAGAACVCAFSKFLAGSICPG